MSDHKENITNHPKAVHSSLNNCTEADNAIHNYSEAMQSEFRLVGAHGSASLSITMPSKGNNPAICVELSIVN